MEVDAREALRMVEEQIAVLKNIVNEIDATIAALKELKERKDALIPISGSVLVPVKMTEENVLVAVGGDVMLEKSVEEAIEILAKRKKEVQASLEKVRMNRQRILAKMQKR